MKRRSYYPNYYSLSDIIATQEKIKCETKLTPVQLGFKNTDVDTDVNFDGKMELPMWAIDNEIFGESLHFNIPDMYNKVFREMCDADPASIELGKINKHYYELGEHVIQEDVYDDFEYLLHETCRQRCKMLIDLCKNTTNESVSDYKMDNSEYNLYINGCKSSKLFSNWLSTHSGSLETCIMVNNYRKRKLQAMLAGNDDKKKGEHSRSKLIRL